MRWSIAPSLLVEDLVSTANYYRDALGFRYGRFWGGPPGVCMVQRQGIVIMLRRATPPGAVRPNARVDPDAWDAYVWVDDADRLKAEPEAKGVRILRDLCDQVYGCRDFEIEDCNGYRLCFGHDTTHR